MNPFEFYVNSWYENRLFLKNIFYCQIHLTKKCEYSCAHCYFRELPTEDLEIPLDKLLSLINRIKKQSSLLGLKPRIDFTGGDPFLYSCLSDATHACKVLNIPYGFKCNPDYIVSSYDKIGSIVENSDGISLSVEGLRDVHDSIRGSGSFDKTISAIEKIKNNNIRLKVSTTVSHYNINELIPLINFFINERIIIDDFTWARYWSLDKKSLIINSAELERVFDEMTAYLSNLFSNPSFYIRTSDGRYVPQIMFGFKEHQWYPYFVKHNIISASIQNEVLNSNACLNCTATKHFYIIDPDLSIYKCRKLPETRINLDDFGTVSSCDIQLGEAIQCKKCQYYNGCGGCSAIAKAFTDNACNTEPMCPYRK